MPKQTSKFDFEKSMQELETIVDEMDEGELSLEEAMAQFEKGVKLTRDCHKTLQSAEQKVKILVEKQGELSLEDFEDDEVEDEDA
jgi:exodeoxyribonuclease VII small subunit